MGCSQSKKKKDEELKNGQNVQNQNQNNYDPLTNQQGNNVNVNNTPEDDWIQKMKRDIQNQ